VPETAGESLESGIAFKGRSSAATKAKRFFRETTGVPPPPCVWAGAQESGIKPGIDGSREGFEFDPGSRAYEALASLDSERERGLTVYVARGH
jgi:hypothetical protein